MTGDICYICVANPDNMYRDIYYGMELTIFGHPDDDFNGIYIASDYLYDDGIYKFKYVYFINPNGMHLYYWEVNGETNGYWRLHNAD